MMGHSARAGRKVRPIRLVAPLVATLAVACGPASDAESGAELSDAELPAVEPTRASEPTAANGWREYRNEGMGLAVRLPPHFQLHSEQQGSSACELELQFRHQWADTVGTAREIGTPGRLEPDRVLAMERGTDLTILLTPRSLEDLAAETGFSLEDAEWFSHSMTTGGWPPVRAEEIQGVEWFGLYAEVGARLYYEDAGYAGQGVAYRYLGARRRDEGCTAFVWADRYEEEGDEETFVAIVSGLRFF